MRKQIPTTHTNLDLTNIDHVSSNQQWDTCQGPTELLLDWLFDTITLDSKIQIKYIDT